MATPKYKPLRCSAIIPLTDQDGVECGSLAYIIVEEGARCLSCFEQYGGTLLTDVEDVTPEQMASETRFLSAHLLEIANPVHVRKPYDLGTAAITVLDKLTGGAL